MPTLPDLSDTTSEYLSALGQRVADEVRRRYVLATAETAIAEQNQRWLEAAGKQPGDPWTQPTGAYDALPLGWIATHDGRTWESLTSANAWEPGVSGWREVVAPDAAPAEWVQPTGAHDAYAIGARVSFGGSVYESTIAANTWSPTANPAGWLRIGG